MNAPQNRPIDNTEAEGNDLCTTPFRVSAWVVLIQDKGMDLPRWFHQTMDEAAGRRMVETINAGPASAQLIEVPLILPAAANITDALNAIYAEPVRIQMSEEPNVYKEVANRLFGEGMNGHRNDTADAMGEDHDIDVDDDDENDGGATR